MKLIVFVVSLAAVFASPPGCAMLQTPAEQITAKVIDKLDQLKPETAQYQANGMAINPKAGVSVEVIAGTIVRVTTTAGVDGVAASGNMATQATATQPATGVDSENGKELP